MKISFVHSEDWQGLYVHNELCLYAHKINPVDILDEIIPRLQRHSDSVLYQEINLNQEWVDERLGDLPDCLIDIPDSAILYIKNVEWQL